MCGWGCQCSALCLQVLLPVEPDARVPDWILDRTPAEVKAAYAAALRKRNQGRGVGFRLGLEYPGTAPIFRGFCTARRCKLKLLASMRRAM